MDTRNITMNRYTIYIYTYCHGKMEGCTHVLQIMNIYAYLPEISLKRQVEDADLYYIHNIDK